MTVLNYVKGLVTIHTTSDINSPHIDYNDAKNLTISEVENYGATGTVQLINNVTNNTKNLLSASCNIWSDGQARKMDRAMFLRIYHTQRDTNHAIGVFLITQITASDNLLTLTFCDSIQYLRSVGSDYVRNHFATSATWNVSDGVYWDSTNSCGIIQHNPSIPIHGGSSGDIMFGKKTETKYNVDKSLPYRFDMYSDRDTPLTFEFPCTATGHKLSRLTVNGFKFPGGEGAWITISFTAIIYSGNTEIYRGEHSGQGENLSFTFNIGENGMITTETNMRLVLSFHNKGVGYIIGLKGANGDNCRLTYPTLGEVHTTGAALNSTMYFYEYTSNITGSSLTSSNWKIESVDGNTPTSDEFDPTSKDKALLLYVIPDAQIAANTVFQRILQAHDFTANDMFNTRLVHTFRCNGDCIHNYLLALADMPNGTTQFAFRSSKTVWNHIDTGYRSKNTDTSQKTIKYAKESGTGIDFLTFNPSISLKNNPRLAVAKGTDANDKPIMVALIDPNVPIGAMSTSVNASITTEVEGALACYSNIMTNRSQDWQGEITLSGIDLAYFQTGIYVGGVPVTVNDSRYGFTDYRAKVKEVKWDFANQKTTITINNYSEIYSNAILDTSKMAYSAGDMSAEASNDDMFVRQFVNIDATGMTSDGSTNDCWFYVDSGSEGHVTDAVTVDLPELNIRMVNAYFPQGNGKSASQYGVNSVKIGNRTHSIPVARRPDKYENQSLIVNVIYKLS